MKDYLDYKRVWLENVIIPLSQLRRNDYVHTTDPEGFRVRRLVSFPMVDSKKGEVIGFTSNYFIRLDGPDTGGYWHEDAIAFCTMDPTVTIDRQV